jgi:uroporphyrin-III C-methyltransferase
LPPASHAGRWFALLLAMLLVGVAVAVAMLWQRVDFVQTESARRLQQAETAAAEARAASRQAADETRAALARLAVAEAKLQDYTAQRAAIDRLLSDTATREQTRVLAEFDQLLTLAEQEAQIAASPSAILAALKSLEVRADAAAPSARDRLKGAIAKDTQSLQSADWPDRVQLMLRFDELAKLIDELPLASDVKPAKKPVPAPNATDLQQGAMPTTTAPTTTTTTIATPTSRDWRAWTRAFFSPMTQWFEVRRVDSAQALLLSPEQGDSLRENLKLQLYSARLSLLSRSSEGYLRSITQVQNALIKFADPKQPRTAQALQLVRRLQETRVGGELPRARETRAVLVALGTK